MMGVLGIGNQQFTDEEKSEARQVVRNWGLKQLEALEPFKVVQRILAFTIIFVWAFLALNCVVAIWFDAYHTNAELANKMLSLASNDVIFWPTVSVLSLYFSGGVVESFKRKK
jgi:membrane protease YdiL (CAAX protease family)